MNQELDIRNDGDAHGEVDRDHEAETASGTIRVNLQITAVKIRDEPAASSEEQVGVSVVERILFSDWRSYQVDQKDGGKNAYLARTYEDGVSAQLSSEQWCT